MAEEKKPEAEAATAGRKRTTPRQRRQKSALRYITILFAAAFVLLLFTYLMERREMDVVLQENQEQIADLQQSVSAVQSLKDLYAQNESLMNEIAALETEISRLETEKNTLSGHVTNVELSKTKAEKGLQAMDWFWQIDEAYVRGRNSLCRELIANLDNAGLTEYLPRQSITNNERFSPYDRLAEIREKLG